MMVEVNVSMASVTVRVDADTKQKAANIAEDLGADSMDVVDLIMSIEDEFEIEVPDESVENIKTVGDVVNFIENEKARRRPTSLQQCR